MRADPDIRSDVLAGLDRDPQVGVRDIAVAVHDGVVTLAGFVHSYRERARAVASVMQVADVGGVADDIEVRMPLFGPRPDPEMARELVTTMRRELASLCARILVYVARGQVTLEGEVDVQEQRLRAEELAAKVRGIHSIRNEITVTQPGSGRGRARR